MPSRAAPEEFRRRVGRLFLECRTARGMTQQEAAKRAGISNAMLCQIETGKSQPGSYTLGALCRLYEISPAFVLYGD